jgi:hypothetical protein
VRGGPEDTVYQLWYHHCVYAGDFETERRDISRPGGHDLTCQEGKSEKKRYGRFELYPKAPYLFFGF